ncbi:MAG: hypothetical protein AAF990_07690 [Bacteroidota bacterium]
MKKQLFFGMAALVAVIMMSFAYLRPADEYGLETYTMEELRTIHKGEFERMSDYLQVDKILEVESTELADGTYSVDVKSMTDGQVTSQTLYAQNYSPNGLCGCAGCNTFVPHYGFKRKLVIGTKCWCFVCAQEVPREPSGE